MSRRSDLLRLASLLCLTERPTTRNVGASAGFSDLGSMHRRAAPARRNSRANARPYNRRKCAACAAARCWSATVSATALSAGGSRAAMLRQHHARLRFSPSRCAILPSLRSLTIAGANSVAGCRVGNARQELLEPDREQRGMGARHAQGLDQRRRQELVAARLPCLAIAVGAEPVERARSRMSSASAGSKASAHSSDRISANAVLKCVPTRIG